MENKRVVKKTPKNKAFTTDSQEPDVIVKHDFSEVVSEKDQVLDAFKFFDPADKGFLSCREYFNLLLATGELKEEEIALIIKESGLAMNDNVNYSNFYDFWKYQ